MFVHGELFQPRLLLVGKARSLPMVEHLKGSSIGQTDIRLGWKGLPWTNTLAYYEHS